MKFGTSNYKLDRPLLKGKNLKNNWINERWIREEFVALREKTYSLSLIVVYLIDNGNEDKKANSTKMSVIKRKLKFEDSINCLKANQLENKITHLEKNEIEIIKDYKKQ